MVDNRSAAVRLTRAQVQFLCNRHTGIGADGVILIESHPDVDFLMNYYNSDGSQSFCGNGSRCAVDFFRRLSGVEKELHFEAIDGLHSATLIGDEHCIKMRDAGLPERLENGYFIHTGSPHVVIESLNVHQLDVQAEGAKVRYSERWRTEGTNVNFIERDGNELHVRTYERGVENETLSCGTGVTAVALIDGYLHGGTERRIHTQGGVLTVRWETSLEGFRNIELQGPATSVFSGVVDLGQ